MTITYRKVIERIESAAKEIVSSETTFPEMPDRFVYADSARGIYIPQYFAESVDRDKCNISHETLDYLMKGPDQEFYWDIWAEVLDSCVLTDSNGQQWKLYQDGDLFCVPAGSYDAWESFQSDLEALQDEAHDKAHTEVDSWDWSIYTYQGFQVYDSLSSDEQSEAESLFEEAGGYEYAAEAKQGPYEMGCTMAFHWLVNSLADAIRGQCDELIELAQGELDKF